MSKDKRPAKADKKKRATRGVPVCVGMLACNQIVIGEDKVATLVRVVDTVGASTSEGRKIGEVGEISGVTLFMAVKRGESSGPFELLLWQVDPHQRRSKIGRVSYEAKGEPDTGINIFSPVRVVWGGEGLYWFELTTQNGKLMAKTPLRIFVGTPEEINRKVEARNQTGL